MNAHARYRSPTAFRAALEQRLRDEAKESGIALNRLSTLEPTVVVMTELERQLMANGSLQTQIVYATAHPEQQRPRRRKR